jgi:methyl-accepting chemotaxis protein
MDIPKDASVPASAAPARFKRGIVLVKRGLQTKFIVFVMMCVLLSVCLILGDIYYMFGRDSVVELMDPGLYDLFIQINKVLLIKVVVFMFVVAVVTIFLSHKLVGPIYRFEKSTQQVATGDLTHRVHLRQGDELMDLQDQFNKMVQSIHDRVAKDRSLAERISRQLDELLQDKGLSADSLSRLKQIRTEVDHITHEFKV